MKTLLTAALIALSATSSVSAQEYIDMTGFANIQQGVKTTRTSINEAPKQTTADKRKAYCESNLTTFNHYITINDAALDAFNMAARTSEEQQNVLRIAKTAQDKAREYQTACESNSATVGRTEVAFREFTRASQALQNKVGNIK